MQAAVINVFSDLDKQIKIYKKYEKNNRMEVDTSQAKADFVCAFCCEPLVYFVPVYKWELCVQ